MGKSEELLQSKEKKIPDILIVDDMPSNVQLLASMLKNNGYKVRVALTGKRAIEAICNCPPDIILLDITMPEMNGYEVCEELKKDSKLNEIPVIFISALHETANKVQAFQKGGVDYISKPFQLEEVAARISTHLELRRQKCLLQESYNELRKLENFRDSLIHMIVHDMRAPLVGIKGFLELLESIDGEKFSDKGKSFVLRMKGGTEILVEMINSLLDVHKMESGKMELKLSLSNLVSLAQEALAKLESLLGIRKIIKNFPSDSTIINCDPFIISRVIQNLISNAIKFTPESTGEIFLSILDQQESILFSVKDNGPGIPTEYHQKIFEKFGQVESRTNYRKYSTGLGLTFCRLAVEAHGGFIKVESEVGKGSNFIFSLPKQEENYF